MNQNEMMKILADNAYTRTGGSSQELTCANYIKDYCASFGASAYLEPFPVNMAKISEAHLFIDGKEIPCKGYFGCGSGEMEAPFYYLTNKDELSLSRCKGKIVMIDTYMGYWPYQDIIEHGAVGFITYYGDKNYPNDDIDQRELRSYVSKGNVIFGVTINVKDAISMIAGNPMNAKISITQEQWVGESRNVVLELPGEIEDTIVFSAHYDSTSLSYGVYDNMSGGVCLLAIAQYYANHPHRHSLRFLWCGSEERGLLGSKYHSANNNLDHIVLNINIDMIGCIMGKFIACCTAEKRLVSYIEYFAMELGQGISVSQDVYSSDSTPFADHGVPAISFARIAPKNTATIHNRYDTMEVMKAEHMAADIAFIQAFAARMIDAHRCPVDKTIPDNMREQLDHYLGRKRKKDS